jgi:hypothetical protein
LKVIAAATAEIKGLLRRTHEDVLEIGRQLNAIRLLIPKRKWQQWLKNEFGMSQPTAYRFMRIAKEFGDDIAFPRNAIDRIDRHALFLLSDPNVSKALRLEVATRAQAGERVSHAAAREMMLNNSRKSLPKAPVIEGQTNIVSFPEPEDTAAPPLSAGLVPMGTLLGFMEQCQRASHALKFANEVRKSLNNAQLDEGCLAVIVGRSLKVAEAWRRVALAAEELSPKKGAHLAVIGDDDGENDTLR